jgi:Ca2+-binding EF-hand superfamily protein
MPAKALQFGQLSHTPAVLPDMKQKPRSPKKYIQREKEIAQAKEAKLAESLGSAFSGIFKDRAPHLSQRPVTQGRIARSGSMKKISNQTSSRPTSASLILPNLSQRSFTMVDSLSSPILSENGRKQRMRICEDEGEDEDGDVLGSPIKVVTKDRNGRVSVTERRSVTMSPATVAFQRKSSRKNFKNRKISVMTATIHSKSTLCRNVYSEQQLEHHSKKRDRRFSGFGSSMYRGDEATKFTKMVDPTCYDLLSTTKGQAFGRYTSMSDTVTALQSRIMAELVRSEMSGNENLEKLFLQFDKNNNGYLEPAEVRDMIDALVPGDVSTVAANELIKGMDADGNGDIDVKEFKSFFKEKNEESKNVIHQKATTRSWTTPVETHGVMRPTKASNSYHEQQKTHHTRIHRNRSSISGGFLGAAVTTRATANAKMVGQNALDGVLSPGFGHVAKTSRAVAAAKAYLKLAVQKKSTKLDQIWARFDPSGVGELTFDQFVELVQWLCPNEINHSSMIKMLHDMDENGDVLIQKTEFIRYLKSDATTQNKWA